MSDPTRRYNLYVQILTAIRERNPTTIGDLLHNSSPADRHWVLHARSNACLGNLTFLAILDPACLSALLAPQTESTILSAIGEIEDGNTTLTEALQTHVACVRAVLEERSPGLRRQLLLQKNCRGLDGFDLTNGNRKNTALLQELNCVRPSSVNASQTPKSTGAGLRILRNNAPIKIFS